MSGYINRFVGVISLFALLCALLVASTDATSPLPQRIYHLPWLAIAPTPTPQPYAENLAQANPPDFLLRMLYPFPAQPTVAQGEFVTRQGEQLFLYGKPFTFVGSNVSYLLEDYFPEAEMEKALAYLTAAGATALRVWVYPKHDLDRAARLFDLGRKYNLRFIVTLEDYYYDKGPWWFDNSPPYRNTYLPHVRKTVARFRDRPEIIAWELMNEPNCSKDDLRTCPPNLVRWAKNVSAEIKSLDPNHLISVGSISADGDMETYRQLHAPATIDLVSLHKRVGDWFPEEAKIAHELGKPMLIGEVYFEAYNQGCGELHEGALEKRAAAIASDLQRAWSGAEHVAGYLLWQYGHGQVVVGKEVQHYCGGMDYMRGDPVWKLIQATPVTRAPFRKTTD
jgi:hypothetical protein